MTRWIFRFLGILLLLVFFIMFANLQRRLIELQQTRDPAPARSR